MTFVRVANLRRLTVQVTEHGATIDLAIADVTIPSGSSSSGGGSCAGSPCSP